MLVEPNPDPTQPVVGYVEPRGAVGVDRRFGKHFIASLAQNVQGEIPVRLHPVAPIAQPLPTILLSYPQLITTLDFRDSTVHPHTGFYLSNDLQVAGLGGSARDVRVQPEARGYVPIARGVTFAARGQVGFLFAQNYGDYVQNHLSQPRRRARCRVRRTPSSAPSTATSRSSTSAASSRAVRARTAAFPCAASPLTASFPS